MERYEISYSQAEQSFAIPAGANKPGGLALAIGFFDGVHLGHAEVIRTAVKLARARGQTPAVLTFDPHPRVVLGHDQYHTVLTPLPDKLALFERLGVEAAFVVSFDTAFSQVTADRFVERLLLPLGVATAVVGFDFKFGHRGQGNADLLRRKSGGAIDVQVVQPVFRGDAKVSSTRIRELLAQGRCDEAAELLNRPFEIRGKVIHGKALGRQLGFPTANLESDWAYVIPLHGVYAVKVTGFKDGKPVTADGVINVGVRPTVDAPGGEPKLEVHLFDFSGDLYGGTLTVQFRHFLRPEMKFGSLDELIAQIGRDAQRARELLASE
ncbi:bifunctional riboflavin kinase/FAD synthetase [Cohnella thermotolerans]|uniref:bifunctional riboflavin kinase/FAD synthetase n=1 Tax=Cohnella thermotolerans TaxID=329858 RepID=UPI000404C855|nr:bifunctional riboflavin kinase/FAD synthetase [Cohnella thermotolerans]